jgi:hypothetical protein
MEAVRTSETSVYSNETVRFYIPERSHPHGFYLAKDKASKRFADSFVVFHFIREELSDSERC